MTKKEALEKYLGVEVTERDNDYFETEDGEEYRVYDDDEAYEATKEEIESFIDDLGIGDFTEQFKTWIIDNAVDKDFCESVVRKDVEFDVHDMQYDPDEVLMQAQEYGLLDEDATVDDLYDGIDEDLIEKRMDEIDDYADYLKDVFGEDEFFDMIAKNNAYDVDKIVDEAIEWDGRGHFLAAYDGDEIELDDGNGYIEYYAYRWN